MRISDWSSDVCSSDLRSPSRGSRASDGAVALDARVKPEHDDGGGDDGRARYRTTSPFMRARLAVGLGAGQLAFAQVVVGGSHARALAPLAGVVVAQNGRAAGRERGCRFGVVTGGVG